MEKLDLEFYIGVNFLTNTYVVCDKKSALAYEKIIDVSGDLSQLVRGFLLLSAEKGARIKAIQIAKTIKDYLNVKELNLTLKTDCRALEKNKYLTECVNKYANKNDINLKVCWIEEGQINLADEYLRLKSGNQYDNNFDIEKYCQENKLK